MTNRIVKINVKTDGYDQEFIDNINSIINKELESKNHKFYVTETKLKFWYRVKIAILKWFNK